MFSNATRSFFVLLLALLYQSTQSFYIDRENFTCPTANGTFPVPGENCTGNYYSCVNGIPTEKVCPSGAVFDPDISKCTSCRSSSCYPNCTTNANTTTTTTATTATESTPSIHNTTTAWSTHPTTTPSSSTNTTTAPTPTPSAPITCNENGNYPNPDDCHTFYMCSNGIPYLYDCPSELVFNPNTKSCDYAINVPGC